jgi:hypothetical protein
LLSFFHSSLLHDSIFLISSSFFLYSFFLLCFLSFQPPSLTATRAVSSWTSFVSSLSFLSSCCSFFFCCRENGACGLGWLGSGHGLEAIAATAVVAARARSGGGLGLELGSAALSFGFPKEARQQLGGSSSFGEGTAAVEDKKAAAPIERDNARGQSRLRVFERSNEDGAAVLWKSSGHV